jgi:hypothetical protein
MSGYLAGLSCLALVFSPLYIPVAVTIVHWLRNRRPSRTVTPAHNAVRRH